VFRLEFFEILLIGVVLWRLLVLGQLGIVFLFGGIGLAFAGVASVGWQDLPALPDNFCNFREG
jgi:hypothetical protein